MIIWYGGHVTAPLTVLVYFKKIVIECLAFTIEERQRGPMAYEAY